MAPTHNNLAWIEKEMTRLLDAGLLVNIRTIESPMDGWVTIQGRRLLNFCANNYLGLANHPRLRQAASEAIAQYGVGPGAVRTIAGTTSLHIELERRLADFKKAEACITLQSGFMANLAVIPALMGENDVILSDELNHASIIDACRLSRARVVRYRHVDVEDLAQKIAESKEARRRLIVTDGVFSMDGDIAPLPDIVAVAEQAGVMVMVDDAHGEGVLGKGGRGIVDHFDLHGRVDVEVGTMSKAFGVVGGLVAGKPLLIDWLRQRARPFLFSSAMTAPDVAACIEATQILSESTELVDRLWQNAALLRQGMRQLGFDTGLSQTPILPILLGKAPVAQRFSRRLLEEGLFATAVSFPTVPMGKARVRIMNSAAHSRSELEQALDIFERVGRELDVI
jgi:glycine C-acetyltransferase